MLLNSIYSCVPGSCEIIHQLKLGRFDLVGVQVCMFRVLGFR
jgi:hypothetical protein